MKISMWTGFFNDLTPEEAICRLAKADYRYAELSTDHAGSMLERAGTPEAIGAAFGAFAREEGVSVLQGHLYLKADLCNPEMVELLKKWLDLFQGVGIRSAVLHASGGAGLSAEQQFELRVAHLNELTRHIRGGDMTICLENLGTCSACYTTTGIFEMINAVDDNSNLGICLDTGHLHRVNFQQLDNQSFGDFIHAAGSRLKALHINGNNGLLDDHLMPYTGIKSFDWKPVMQALREVGYDGLFNLELPGERRGPLQVRMLKLEYLKKLCAFMASDEFLKAE